VTLYVHICLSACINEVTFAYCWYYRRLADIY